MSTEKKEPKTKFVLPPEARLMMVSTLESAKIMDADSMDDEEILKRYNDEVLRMQQKVNNFEISAETKSLNQYMGQNERIKLEDKDFIERLFRLNVPFYYLHIFKDSHASLSNKEIWELINKSGINPLNECNRDDSVLFKMQRSPVTKKEVRF